MGPDSLLLDVMPFVLAACALALAYFAMGEVVELVRQFIAGMREASRAAARAGQPPDAGMGQRIEPFRDRETVERLIDYFEEE